MSKARGLADLGNAYSDGALSNRNLIINGAMQVAQRGTSVTVSNAVNFVADRHKISVYDTGFANPSGGTIQQIDITGTNLGGVTFKSATRLTPNSTWALTYFLQQMEDVASIADTEITFSIWMRVGTGTLTLTDDLRITQNFGSGGSAAVSTNVPSSRVVTTDWQRFTWTMTVPSVSGKTIGAGNYLQLNVLNAVDLSSFSSTLDLTGFQVEVGDTATPFEHRSYSDELQRCMRYYERSYSYGTALGAVTSDGADVYVCNNYNSGQVLYSGHSRFKVEKRVNPTLSFWSHTGVANQWFEGKSGFSEALHAAPTPLWAGTSSVAYYMVTVGSSSDSMYGHWTADAEL